MAAPPYANSARQHKTDEFCQRTRENIRKQPDLYLLESHKRWENLINSNWKGLPELPVEEFIWLNIEN